MATIRFQAGEVGLELAGSERFVERQLLLLAPLLGDVDSDVITTTNGSRVESSPVPDPAPAPAPAPQPVRISAPLAIPDGVPVSVPESNRGTTVTQVPAAAALGFHEEDGLRSFYLAHEPHSRDAQTDAALLLAYYLNRMEGRKSLRVGDLVQSCIRAGVDTRNLNRPIGLLTRRGLLEQGAGNTYRISSQGVQTVESRL